MSMTVLTFTEKLQALINTILRQDGDAFAAVRELSGKIIKIEISGPDLIILLHLEQEGIRISSDATLKTDVTIKASPGAFLQLLLDRSDNQARYTPHLEIKGDASLAQRIQQILQTLEVDWEEHLSHWVGDTAAHKLGRILRQTRDSLKEARHTLGMDLSEYLRYEKEMLPEREEVEEFIAAVDVLRNDTERLKQRLGRLQGKINA